MKPDEESYEARMERLRDPNAQPGFYTEQFILDTQIRVPFLNRWFERRRAEKRVRRMRDYWRTRA